jgi:hypothetical protein
VAKRGKSSLKRKDAFFLTTDAKKLIDRIEAAGASVKPAIENAARKSLPIVQKEFQAFISAHKLTGDTEASLIDPSQVEMVWGGAARKRYDFKSKSVKVYDDESILYFQYGFDANNGGLPALFLDVGTPKITPSFFIYYAVENNLSKIHALQREELMKIVEGLK